MWGSHHLWKHRSSSSTLSKNELFPQFQYALLHSRLLFFSFFQLKTFPLRSFTNLFDSDGDLTQKIPVDSQRKSQTHFLQYSYLGQDNILIQQQITVMSESGKDVAPNPASEKPQFPEGLRVLAVDDNVVCLKVIAALLIKCRFVGSSYSHIYIHVYVNVYDGEVGFFRFY